MERDTRANMGTAPEEDPDRDGEVERTPPDQVIVWGMLPLFALIAAILVVLIAFVPIARSHLLLVIPTVIALVLGGYYLIRGVRQLR